MTHTGEQAPVTAPGRPGPPSHRRTGRVLAGTAVVVALGCAGAAFAVLRDSGGDRAGPRTALPTAAVIRTDLAQQTQVDGTLSFAHAYTIDAGGQGRLTWLPQEGDTVSRGGRVYGLDGHPVPLFYGPTPLWRRLATGVTDGADVRELERNLAALGYDDGGSMSVDEHFSAATAQAVRDWQNDLGVTETGAVSPGEVVLRPGALRITTVTGALGSPAQGHILTATGTTRQVTVNLPVTEEEIAVRGTAVSVQLPGSATTTGHISKIGTVASSGADTSGQGRTGQGTQTATVPVSIELDHPRAAGRFDGAPVTVTFSSGVHHDVLAVPVNALLAMADGRYVLDVVQGAAVRVVPVTLGIFAGGQVEVGGPGLAEGMRVEVPRS